MNENEKLEWYAAGYEFGRDINKIPMSEDMDGFSTQERDQFLNGASEGILANNEINNSWNGVSFE